MSDLKGKTAIVTGASSGIGRATAVALAARGARVALIGRRKEALDSVASEIGGAAIGFVADVGKEEEATLAVRGAWDALGGVDYLVHAAGIITPARLEALTASLWRQHIDVNLNGAFYIMRECALRMRERGSGSIAAIASDLSFKGLEYYAHYCASKAGLAGLTKAMALELAPIVRVNSVCPGPVDTPMMESELKWFGGTDDVRQGAVSQVPLKRFASPEEIAKFAVFVAVDATFATGAMLSVDGGTTAR
ncbi:SDR family oxidoreductase [Rhizobium vallis]|uniref:SDR family oxidoreductase n=1 Tax=Rhizobium vallis TaxID=634290 RepID=A0A432PC89_9HYPH|nr:SDR family NAD(P)-dependent oxidoreductase [Rhizobium vallis]RUM20501.1 SDR family oxidoreductase [Rhizobium vallis]